MTHPRDFLALLTLSAMITGHHCKAACPPPPTGLSYKWLDPFTVKVSWQKPSGLPASEFEYKYIRQNGLPKEIQKTKETYFSADCYTEEIGSDQWTYVIWTVNQSCQNRSENKSVSITIHAPKPRIELEHIEGLLSRQNGSDIMNCSWMPRMTSFKLRYRVCGQRNDLKECEEPYSTETRSGCSLKDGGVEDICISVETETGRSTVRAPKLMVHPPELSVKAEGDKLILSWVPPEIAESLEWEYHYCYKKCNKDQGCHAYKSSNKSVPYERGCLYEFKSSVNASYNTKKISSDFGAVVQIGENDETLTVVAILIPLTLSFFMVLACYCFRRHSAIICPDIPDPSAIFKETMMNGNKELKATAGSLYTPVPEPVEPCKITLIPKSTILQQNS